MASEEQKNLSSSSAPPKDTFNLAYCIYFLLGAGYLVPWNAFITAIDYFELLYPSRHIDYVFSIVYMVPAVICILLMTFFGRRISATLRVNVGLFIFIAMLIVIPVMGAFFITDAKGTNVTYVITIVAATLNGVADSLVQGSVVGSAGELPSRYMQAVMSGTAASGVLISVLRIISRAVMPQNQSGIEASAYLYFIVSIVIMIVCVACYNLVGKLRVMQYYERLKSSQAESVHLLDHNIRSDEVEEQSKVQEMRGPKTAENVSEDLNIAKSVSYIDVWKKVQGLALSIAFIYVVTLSIFPGHITEDLNSSYFGDWYAIILTLAYNLFDFIGKFLPGFPMFMTENRTVAIGGSVARALFYLLFYLCVHGPSFFQLDTVVIISTCLLGLTNGYFTSVLMILAPNSVPVEEAEVTGFLMVMFLILGLAAGSILEWVWVI
eukprot:c18042_g1_i1 orf=205-1512(+)